MRNWRKESGRSSGPGVPGGAGAGSAAPYSSTNPRGATDAQLAIPPTPRRVRANSETPEDSGTMGITDITFFETLNMLTQTLAAEFPSEPFFVDSATKLSAFGDDKVVEGRRLASLFHNDFKAYYPLIMQKSETVFALPHPLFTEYKAANKWASLSTESQTKLWEISSSLVHTATLSSVLSKCSSQMLSTLSSFSGDVFTRMKSGELDLTSLMSNPTMLMSMMSSKLNVAEIEEFGRTLSEDGDAQTMIMTMMSALNGKDNGLMSSLGGLQTLSGLPGLSGLGGLPGLDLSGIAENLNGVDLSSFLAGLSGLGSEKNSGSDMGMD